MRIAFTPNAYPPAMGGAEHHTQRLARGLAALGHDVHVIAPDAMDGHVFYEVGIAPTGTPEEIRDGVSVHRVPVHPAWWNPLGHLPTNRALARIRRKFARGLERTLRSIRPEVVVTLPHLVPNVEETLALRPDAGWRVAYAPMLHEEDPWWPADRIRQAVESADGIIALTPHERDRLIEAYGASPGDVTLLPPGVDVPERADPGDRDRMVLFVGRRTASKRLDVLYEAMQIVWESIPEASLVIAGPPPGQGPDPTAGFVDDPRVEILGPVPNDRRDALLARAALVASASVIEAFGITVLEAWAHATPVVVVDTPVRRSVVRSDVDGIITPRDAPGLAAGIVGLLTRPADAQRLGAAGRLRVEREFRWDDIVARLEDFLASL